MRRLVAIRKWLFIMASSSLLLQAAPGGCPDSNQLLTAASTGTQAFLNAIISVYVKAGANTIFGI